MRWHPGAPHENVSVGEYLKGFVVFFALLAAVLGGGFMVIHKVTQQVAPYISLRR